MIMREQVSALLDGELDDVQMNVALEALQDDTDLCRDWQIYHLIGDVMRGDGVSVSSIAERVSAQLVDEPVLAMPAPAVPQEIKSVRHHGVAANRAWYSLAASVAGVAFVGWAAWSSLMPAAHNGAAVNEVAHQSVPTVASDAQPVAYQSQVSDYWMAHRQLSGHMTDSQDQQVQFVSVETPGEERQ